MAGKRDLLRKISSLKNTEKITSAMKMIASTKLLKMRHALDASQPFGDALDDLNARLGMFSVGDDAGRELPLPKKFSGKLHIVLFTGDRGLCGVFNSSTQKITAAILEGFHPGACTITVYGAKGAKFCENRDFPVSDVVAPLPKLPKSSDTTGKADELLNGLRDGRFDEVLLVYNRFVSTLEQVPVVKRFLPDAIRNDDTNLWNLEFEPSRGDVAESLTRLNAEYILFNALLESMTSENAARLAAMENAAANCRNLIDHYKLIFNRSRQSGITTELLEIIAGTEAMKS
ncbi:MAG: ATP synthase F1 subunit gamma [Victivallales bacterium]|nr:ATP synthase F1 subunit gamma [Victivallales bacterium]